MNLFLPVVRRAAQSRRMDHLTRINNVVHVLARGNASTSTTSLEVEHSQFLAEAPPKAKWGNNGVNGDGRSAEDELEGVTSTRGKLLPTSSHLFKLVLPLADIKNSSVDLQTPPSSSSSTSTSTQQQHPSTPPTIFLLHPSQPLSHISRLIASSISPTSLNPHISFRGITPNGNHSQWSDSTDVGDFIRDAARAAEFRICISYGIQGDGKEIEQRSWAGEMQDREQLDQSAAISGSPKYVEDEHNDPGERVITVAVPTFADRTKFLRRRLGFVAQRLADMEGLKKKCDVEAHYGARKMALGGFGMLVVYWGTVARLTFWDLGWDVMEPVTYLSGLSTVVLGYLWFLYQGREVSYTSVLAQSISARRESLYKARGFNIDRWMELLSEKKALKEHISMIARDYEEDELPGEDGSVDEGGNARQRERDLEEEGPSLRDRATLGVDLKDVTKV